jgi:hypothetical protein
MLRLVPIISLCCIWSMSAAASPVVYVSTPLGVTTIDSSGSNSTLLVESRIEGIAADAGDAYITSVGSAAVTQISPPKTLATYATVGGNPLLHQMAADSSGNLFVANNVNPSQLLEIAPGGAVSTFVSNFGSDPEGLAIDSNNNLYISLTTGSTIEITPNKTITTRANIASPYIAVDAQGNLYLPDPAYGTILKVDSSGNETTFASGLSEPEGLAFDSSGNLYVANSTGASITEIAPNGTKSTFASGLSYPEFIAIVPEPSIIAIGALLGIALLRPRGRR